MSLLNKSLISSFSILALSCQTAYADGLNDLKQALASLSGTAEISAVLDTSFKSTTISDDDKDIDLGSLKMELLASSAGLQISYDNETLVNMRQESIQKREDENIATPTLMAANIVNTNSLTSILSSASLLLEEISQGTFVKEQQVDFNGESVRSLSFSLPLNFFVQDEKVRGYVDEFESNYQILINQQGIPLESRMSFAGEGTAYVFFSLEAKNNTVSRYQVVGKRLVRVSQISKSINNSSFNDNEFDASWQVIINPPRLAKLP